MCFTGYILTATVALLYAVTADAQVSPRELERKVDALRQGGPEGRKAGSVQGVAAAEYIAGVFEQAGLFPYFAGQFIDEFTAPPLVGEPQKTYRNVAGIIYGSSYELDGEYIIVGAHYDYAGPGGSSNTVVRDNTSGVAALLELAGAVRSCLPARNVILVAFDGYEAGLLGSRRFVEESTLPAEDMILMVNLSGIGSLPVDRADIGPGDNRAPGVPALYCEGATDKMINHFLAVGRSAGIEANPDGFPGRSDTEPFIAAGVPAIHFTVTDSRPSGTGPEEIDPGALAELTDIIAEGICNLSKDASVNTDNAKGKSKKKKGPRFEGGVSLLAGTSFYRETQGDTRGKTLFSGGAGVYGQVNFAGFLGLRPEVQYIHSGSRSTDNVARMNSVVVPVSLVVQIPPYLAGSLQLLLGGYYRRSFNHNGGFNGFGRIPAGGDVVEYPEMYANGAGLQWGINLRLKSFGIGVTSRYGLTDLYRTSGNNLRERATYATISYNF